MSEVPPYGVSERKAGSRGHCCPGRLQTLHAVGASRAGASAGAANSREGRVERRLYTLLTADASRELLTRVLTGVLTGVLTRVTRAAQGRQGRLRMATRAPAR